MLDRTLTIFCISRCRPITAVLTYGGRLDSGSGAIFSMSITMLASSKSFFYLNSSSRTRISNFRPSPCGRCGEQQHITASLFIYSSSVNSRVGAYLARNYCAHSQSRLCTLFLALGQHVHVGICSLCISSTDMLECWEYQRQPMLWL